MAPTSIQMPSSLSSGSDSISTYDVFLSFRAADTGFTFSDHLYRALIRSRIHTFRDTGDLRLGEEIAPDLVEAIEGSKIYIIVLSETYAHSKWCLEELVEIMKCKKEKDRIVVPIFYHVYPSQVRHQTGRYGEAFAYHERNADEQKWRKIQEWRNALRTATNIAGHDVAENRFESEIIKEIIDQIRRLMPNSGWNYDVFLSFRGADTRHTFTDHLYQALVRNRIQTFRDNEKLPRGGEIGPDLIKAIEGSRISIIIFSESYAHSKWCLEELDKILECNKIWGQIVIPVFYHVELSQVRHQTGSYEEAFAYHERNADEEKQRKIQKWRTALRQASNLSGYHVAKNRFASEYVEEIVVEIRRLLLKILQVRENIFEMI